MSTGQFGDVCSGDFRVISCKGGWLLDPVSLICIHSREGSNGTPHCPVNGFGVCSKPSHDGE